MKRFYQSLITNHNQGRISVSKMEMTTPYFPESVLAKSKFHGFYSLFYIFTLYFSVVYPLLNFIKTGTFFQKTLFKILEFNLLWDVLSLLLFLVLSFCLMSLSHLTKAICKNLTKRQSAFVFIPLVGFLWSIYVGIGFYIVRTYPMYFTDKIFIVVISWVFFIKTLSYIFDMHQIVEITSKFEVKRVETEATSEESQKDKQENQEKQISLEEITFVRKSSDMLEENPIEKFRTKIIYLISPEIVFKYFILNHDKSLIIHPIYVINKILVTFVCSIVNLIIMIEMLEPLCSKESLEKYQFIELFFRFIPPIFYINICLYFMILENIIPAIAEVTKMKSRIYYEDWWNAESLYDFLDRWVLMINSFTKEYLTLFWQNRKLRQTIHVAIILFLIYEIFSISERKISLTPFLMLSVGLLLCTYFLGGIKNIQGNHLVHTIIFGFSPLMLAIEMKFNIFTGEQK